MPYTCCWGRGAAGARASAASASHRARPLTCYKYDIVTRKLMTTWARGWSEFGAGGWSLWIACSFSGCAVFAPTSDLRVFVPMTFRTS